LDEEEHEGGFGEHDDAEEAPENAAENAGDAEEPTSPTDEPEEEPEQEDTPTSAAKIDQPPSVQEEAPSPEVLTSA